MKIRLATKNDAKAIQNIYSFYVEKTAITFECAVPSIEEFEKRIENTLKNYPYFVAEVDSVVKGYAYASNFRTREAYSRSVETSIYVENNFHRKGIGTELYKTLETELKKQNVTSLYAGVSSENPKSEIFHLKNGYKKIGQFHNCGFKLGKWIDVVWFEKFILPFESNPAPFIPFSNFFEK